MYLVEENVIYDDHVAFKYIHRENIILPANGDNDGGVYLLSVSCKILRVEQSESDYKVIRRTLRKISDYIMEHEFIQRPRSAYDCTGQSFTTDMELIKSFISDGYLHKVYLHHISVDV